MLKDWNGLGEVTKVTEVTAFLGEGIGRNSNTLKLQELGGFFAGGGSAPPNESPSGLHIHSLASSEGLGSRLPLAEKALRR